jgi:hypothetical protein
MPRSTAYRKFFENWPQVGLGTPRRGNRQADRDDQRRTSTAREMKRIGFLRGVSANILDPAALVAAVALILFALTH